jgi:hypothetical protein
MQIGGFYGPTGLGDKNKTTLTSALNPPEEATNNRITKILQDVGPSFQGGSDKLMKTLMQSQGQQGQSGLNNMAQQQINKQQQLPMYRPGTFRGNQ